MAELNKNLFNGDIYDLDPMLDWTESNKETDNKAVSGKAIQDYIKHIKADADHRVGYFYVKTDLDKKPYLLGFKDESSYRKWITDESNNNELVLTKVEIPLAKSNKTTYVNEFKNLDEKTTIISTDNTIILHGIFYSYSYAPGSDTRENNTAETGIVHVQLKQDGSWKDIDINLIVNYGVPFEIDLTKLITTSDPVPARVWVTGELNKEDSNIILYSLIKTNLNIENKIEWWEPQINDYITTSYKITGKVDKILHVRISGEGGTGWREFTKDLGVNPGPDVHEFTYIHKWSDIGINTTHIITHGIHEIEAWVSVKNTDIATKKVKTKVLLIKNEEDKTPKIIINNINYNPINWTSNKFFDFSIYNPTNDRVNAVFNIFDPLIGEKDPYLNETMNSIESNKPISFTNTLDIEGNNSANINTNINIYLNGKLASTITNVNIKNEGAYAPVPEADFILNPKSRNNKDNPEKIYNLAVRKDTIGHEINSTWINFNFNNNDGWIKDSEGNACLRVLKNQLLNIEYNPFFGWEGAHENKNNKSCTIEMYVAIRNVTNLESSILRIYKGNQSYTFPQSAEEIENDCRGTFDGFKLRSLDGIFLTKGLKFANRLDLDIAFRENQMTHIVININHGFIKETKTNIIRMFINGRINREFAYSDSDNIYDTEKTARIISIGGIGADIDIYGLRIYKKSLSTSEIQKDYIAVLPTPELKNKEIEASDILDEYGHISYSKVKNKYNTLLWTYYPGCNEKVMKDFTRPAGMEFGDSGKEHLKQGDLIIRILKEGSDGKPELDKKHSGIFTNISVGGQGTSSMTYWKWNQRWNIDNEECPHAIFRNDLGEYWGGIDDNENGTPRDVSAIQNEGPGSHIVELANYITPVQELTDKGEKVKYQMFDNEPVIVKKFDGKINWASPQQSHKIGSTSLYNDLWKEIIQNNKEVAKCELVDLQNMMEGKFAADGRKFTGTENGYADSRMTVHQMPFFLFILPGKPGTQLPVIDALIGDEASKKTNSDCLNKVFGDAEGKVSTEPVFWGLYTVGAGKGDKPSFGYDKKHWPDYIMMEGCDNSVPLVNHRVPWNDQDITIDTDGEKYIYNNAENWEISMGNKVAGSEAPHLPTKTLQFFKEMCNFVYSLNPNLHGFNGSYENLIAPDFPKSVDTEDFYWCLKDSELLNGHKKYDVYRYDAVLKKWVDAGIEHTTVTKKVKDSEAPGGEKDVTEIDLTKYEKMNLLEQLNITQSDINSNSGSGTLDEINEYFKIKRLELFKGQDKDSGIRKYFDEDDLLYTMQFLKLIAASDNWAKNAYIYSPGQLNYDDETGHHVDDKVCKFRFFQDDLDTIFFTDNSGKKTKPYYVEEYDTNYDDVNLNGYWPSNKNALYRSTDFAFEVEKREKMHSILEAMKKLGDSVMGCFEKYYCNIQRYFPTVAYNETARLLYESAVPYHINSVYTKNISPLTQCLGDQLESEYQWLQQRSTYISSYATQGIWSAADSTTGSGALNFKCSTVDGKSHTYNFELTPYMWLYPSISSGGSSIYPNGSKMSTRNPAGKLAKFNNVIGGANTNIFIRGIHNYTDIGNFALIAIEGGSDFAISGDRLESFKVIGTSEKPILFNPNGLSIPSAGNLKKLIIEGPVKSGYIVGTGTLDLSNLNKLEEVSIPSSNIVRVDFPNDSNITKIHLPKSTLDIILNSLKKLKNFDIVGYTNLTNISIIDTFIDNPEMNYKIFNNCFNSNAKINSLKMNNINWKDFTIKQLEYLCDVKTCDLQGTITLNKSEKLDSKLKIKLINKFGQIDDNKNRLHIKYDVISVHDMKISGYSYVYYEDNEAHPCLYKVIANPINSNNIVDVTWSITPNEFANIDKKTGVLTFIKPKDYITGSSKPSAKISCIVKTINVDYLNNPDDINESDKYKSKEITKIINFYEKSAAIGDYVYADGTFGLPDDSIDEKTLIGICVYINPKDSSDRRMIATVNINDLIVDENGLNLYHASPDKVSNPNPPMLVRWGLDSMRTKFEIGINNPHVVPGLINKSILSSNKISYNDLFIDGSFKEYAKEENNAYSDLDGLKNTEYIIKHRNNIITTCISLGNAAYSGMRIPGTDQFGDPLDYNKNIWEISSEFNHLTSLILKTQKVNNEVGNGEFTPCLYYQAASYCHAYKPLLKNNEILNKKFEEGNWYLPSFYELALVSWYYDIFINHDLNLDPNLEEKYNIFKKPIEDKKIMDFSGSKIDESTNRFLSSTSADNDHAVSIYIGKDSYYNAKPGTSWKAGDYTYNKFYIRPMAKF